MENYGLCYADIMLRNVVCLVCLVCLVCFFLWPVFIKWKVFLEQGEIFNIFEILFAIDNSLLPFAKNINSNRLWKCNQSKTFILFFFSWKAKKNYCLLCDYEQFVNWQTMSKNFIQTIISCSLSTNEQLFQFIKK